MGDEVAWVSLPGEIFVELGLAIKQDSPFPNTIIAELANGSIGYIPSRRAYAQGNYEVVSARCAEGSGERLVDAACEAAQLAVRGSQSEAGYPEAQELNLIVFSSSCNASRHLRHLHPWIIALNFAASGNACSPRCSSPWPSSCRAGAAAGSPDETRSSVRPCTRWAAQPREGSAVLPVGARFAAGAGRGRAADREPGRAGIRRARPAVTSPRTADIPPGPGPGEPPAGRIAMLEDTDGDGRMDRRTEFAQGLTYPQRRHALEGRADRHVRPGRALLARHGRRRQGRRAPRALHGLRDDREHPTPREPSDPLGRQLDLPDQRADRRERRLARSPGPPGGRAEAHRLPVPARRRIPGKRPTAGPSSG